MKNFYVFTKTMGICALGLFTLQAYAQNANAPSMQPENKAAAAAAALKSAGMFPAGTFGGDDILLKLDEHGRYSLSGDAVEKPLHGSWTIEKKGKHTLLRLISHSKDGDWLFGVRSNDILQAVNEDKLNVLDRPLNATEDAGVLKRQK